MVRVFFGWAYEGVACGGFGEIEWWEDGGCVGGREKKVLDVRGNNQKGEMPVFRGEGDEKSGKISATRLLIETADKENVGLGILCPIFGCFHFVALNECLSTTP